MALERAVTPRGHDLRIAVIAALAIERASLDRHAALAGGAVTIYQSGPGPERAARAARAALAHGAEALVSWGLAGGLDAALAPGSVVVPSAVLVDGASFACSAAWAQAVRSAARGAASARARAGIAAVSDGNLLSVAAPRETPADKAQAAADTGAVAAAMESGAIAAAAASANVPFIAVRVVIDARGDALPTQAERFVDAHGNTRTLAALGAALTPADWPRLIVLARRYRTANAALETLAARLAPAGFARLPAETTACAET
jgi:adenosylhomocysteine nucleosidase